MSVESNGSDGHVEAYCTTGSSPGLPTLHLVGPGAVGRSLLRQLDPAIVRLIAVSDSSGTLHAPEGLAPDRVAELKERAGRVTAENRRGTLDAARFIEIDADIVVDTTATSLDRQPWHQALTEGVLERGAQLVLAAKDGICAQAHLWADDRFREQVRYNAVLGGAGHGLHDELTELRAGLAALAVAGNATTTTIIKVVESGLSLGEGIEVARRAGLLEADPELDFRGVDAAIKLAIVAGILRQEPVDPTRIRCEDIRTLDPGLLRERAARGATTRLVGRLDAGGQLALRYEEVERGAPLDVPADRVSYLYELKGGGSRLHVGDGLGATLTARAALRDIREVVEIANRNAFAGGVR